VSGRGFGFIEAGEATVVALVQPPVLLNRQPEALHFLKAQIERFDRAHLHAGEAQIEVEAAFRHELACGFCFGDACAGEIHVPPAGKAIRAIPNGLAVAEEDETASHCAFKPCRDAQRIEIQMNGKFLMFGNVPNLLQAYRCKRASAACQCESAKPSGQPSSS
jgi:hypothetical protein